MPVLFPSIVNQGRRLLEEPPWPVTSAIHRLLASAAIVSVAATPLVGATLTPIRLHTGQLAPDGISADGQTVVGGHPAWRWTASQGSTHLPPVPAGEALEYFSDVSADASLVTGGIRNGTAAEAILWEVDQEITYLGVLPGFDSSFSTAISADGKVVVGRSSIGDFGQHEAFRWTESTGMVGLGFLPGGSYSAAYRVSADGSVVVGYSGTGTGDEPFLWTESEGMVSLGFEGIARGVSMDGRTIVGTNESGAFVWREGSGIVELGRVPGRETVDSVNAWDVSADGSVVIGNDFRRPGTRTAFIWDESNGMQDLPNVLINNYGLGNALEGWDLGFVYRISPDGRAIIGKGTFDGIRYAWHVSLDTPAADFNGNGAVEQADLDLVLLNWGKDVWPGAGPAEWTLNHPHDPVSQAELDKVLLDWGSARTAAAPLAAAVPEPSTLLLLVLGLSTCGASQLLSAARTPAAASGRQIVNPRKFTELYA